MGHYLGVVWTGDVDNHNAAAHPLLRNRAGQSAIHLLVRSRLTTNASSFSMWLSKLTTHRRAVALVSQQRFAGVHSTRALQYLTETSFESLPISERSKKVLTEQMKYEFLTHVQNETIPLILDGQDVLAKGKTGNGKTIAFLLPSIENMLKEKSLGGVNSKEAKIATLVISPTRELANQIAAEAEKLTAAHGMRTACLVGGTTMNSDVKQLSNPKPLDVLVATPGRLQAHLEENSGNIRQKLGNLRVLVLDEADRLLDMGFRKEIMKIISNLPTQRQTLLFSATLPDSTEELKNAALRPDYAFVDTIHEDEHQTNVQTVQEFVTCDLPNVIPSVEAILGEHMEQAEYKVLVFLPTARAAQFMAQLFVTAKFPNVLEMHSRKSQSQRTKAADAFRSGKNVIMFSSDVSARGVDYPDVSLVLQVGLTDRDQYIHRLGRTARAGMEGRGILLLADFEKPFLKDLSDLPLTEKVVDTTTTKGFHTTEALTRLKPGSELEKSAQQSYQAFLGFYNSNQKKLNLDKEKLVELAEHYSHLIGLSETPRIDKKILRKMGLFGVKGLEPASHAEKSKFMTKGGSGIGSRGGGDRRARSEERSSAPRGPREPRNFGESSSTPPSERFNMDDLPSPREPRQRSRESPRERFGSQERGRGGAPREGRDSRDSRPAGAESTGRLSRFNSGARSDRFSERGGRDRSDRGGRGTLQSPRRFDGDGAPREQRFGSQERGRGREPRFEKRAEGARSSSYEDDGSSPRERRFGSEERGSRGREDHFERRSEGRSSSSPPRQRYGSESRGSSGRGEGRSSKERGAPRTTSHRRDRGEQKARERSERYSKRF